MTTRTITVSQETLDEALAALSHRIGWCRHMSREMESMNIDAPEWKASANDAKRAYDELIRASVKGEGDE